MNKKATSALLGLSIGDALGVPVEFKSRNYLLKNPIIDMTGYGTYHQPLGTWSDDSSLAFCLADSLCNGYNLLDIAKKMVSWYYEKTWTPHGVVFDIGITTQKSLSKLNIALENNNINSVFLNVFSEKENGNGSLMRILPLAFFVKNMDIDEKYKFVREVSYLTHGHIISCLSCLIYISYACYLLENNNKFLAYNKTKVEINNFFNKLELENKEKSYFDRILKYDIKDFSLEEINSSGYVIDTLEACFWNILNFNTFEETVLSSVNMGGDTDTTAAVTGGLAGIIYGIDNIPKKWIDNLVKIELIMELADKFNEKYMN